MIVDKEKNETFHSASGPGHPSLNRLAMLVVMLVKRYVQFYHRAYLLTMASSEAYGWYEQPGTLIVEVQRFVFLQCGSLVVSFLDPSPSRPPEMKFFLFPVGGKGKGLGTRLVLW